MNTDRELLELAAKSCEYTWVYMQALNSEYLIVKELNSDRWNPLTDDGDAFRLAIKLFFTVEVDDGFSAAITDIGIVRRAAHDGDAPAATRRAIVLAAAEIGREMK